MKKQFYIGVSILLTLNQTLLAGTASYNSGNCLSFNGTSSVVSFTNNNLNLDAGNTMTVMAWVKWTDKTNAGQWANMVTLNANTSTGDNGQFWLQNSQYNTNFEFALQTTASRQYTQSVTNPVVGQWYHVAGMYDGAFIYIFVNGVQESRVACTGNITSFQSAFKLVFGEWAFSGNAYRPFNGDIDEVSIWNIALGQTGIRNNMCKKLAGTESGLVGYWRMNETSGNVVYDLTANKRNGTSSNTSIVYSGAPIGDACAYTYGGTSLSLKHPTNNDSLKVSNFSAAVTGIYIYRIDTAPNASVLPTGISSIYNDYYFGVFIVNSYGQTYQVNWYYEGHPGILNGNKLDILSRSNNASLTWSDLSSNVVNSTKYVYNGLQTDRNEYVLATKGMPLPIELIYFDAVLKNTSMEINWSSATEIDNDYYTVERSTNGTDFEAIEKVAGKINSTEKIDYSITDTKPNKGMNYYRLTQTDMDGKTTTYPMVAAEYKVPTVSEVTVYPNPSSGSEFSINITCLAAGTLNVTLFNTEMQQVKTLDVLTQQGLNQIKINATDLDSGLYMLNVSDQNTVLFTTRLIRN